MTPTVSFVVPCYRYAHLLRECIDSILCQTYGNFEVLIIDDCSPDNTSEVAQSFRDPRVKYFRDELDLGHVRSKNRGISLARGKYIWIIDADDYLRRSYILQRYVDLLESHSNVGYTFCSGVGVKNGLETDTLPYSVYGNRDQIIKGHVLLKKILRDNVILAASAMVRRECYEKISFYSSEISWGEDWYLWCVFALYFDVGYFAEAMVCYREHDLSLTRRFTQGKADICGANDLARPWMLRQRAVEAGYRHLSRDFLYEAVNQYTMSILTRRYGMSEWRITLEQFEDSLCRNTSSETERNWVRARVYARIGDKYYWQRDLPLARQFYLAALQKDPGMVKVLVKLFFLLLGNPGDHLRRIFRSRQNKSIGVNPEGGQV
jgi:glycosyltransferase involved in cell wall biosynthesis